MTRTKLIEKLIETIGLKADVKKNIQQGIQHLYGIHGDPDGKKAAHYFTKDADQMDAVKAEVEKSVFAAMMISTISDEDLTEFLAYLNTPAAEKYGNIRAVILEAANQILEQYVQIVGGGFLQNLYVSSYKWLMMVMAMLEPRISIEAGCDLADKCMSTHPIIKDTPKLLKLTREEIMEMFESMRPHRSVKKGQHQVPPEITALFDSMREAGIDVQIVKIKVGENDGTASKHVADESRGSGASVGTDESDARGEESLHHADNKDANED